ncbi:LysR family transcriptional regulator [Thiomicrolovo sp. ZZH C-3]
MYTLKQLELFLDLGRSEKIIDTAKKFGLSQSAVSMAIKELERLLDGPLFERIGKRLVLNGRGAMLMRSAQPHVDALHALYDQMRSDSLRGELRLAASVTIAEYFIPTLVCNYMEQNEHVTISLKSANTADVIRKVTSGEVDIGFIEGEGILEEVESRVLMRDELVVLTSDRTLAERGPWFIDQLASRPWIMREKGSGTRAVFLNAISPVDQELNMVMELEHIESIKNFLLAKPDYLSVLPRISVRRELEEGHLFEIAIKAHHFERDFTMISRSQQTLLPLQTHFQEYLLSSIGLQ